MILRPLPLPWPRFVLLCLLLLVAVIGFGCAKKVAVPGKPGVTKPSKKKKMPATQRPYVINGTTY